MNHFVTSLITILNQMSPYVLLGFLCAGLLHVFVKRDLMVRHLSGRGWKPVVKAALFGIPLPLCSCGVLPTAVSLRRRGASNAATASFLIATPQTGVDSIAATYSLLGLPFAILRPVAALAGAVTGGIFMARSHDNADSCTDSTCAGVEQDTEPLPRGLPAKMLGAVKYGFIHMVSSVGKWLIIGLIVAAAITVFVPESFFVSLSRYPLLAMLAMVAVAIPMYICATGSIPIALSLMLKGLSPGAAFVLLMAGPAANFASVMVLGRTMGRRATAAYVTSVAVTAMLFGLIIDYLLPAEWFIPAVAPMHAACPHHTAAAGFPWFDTTCSALLTLLLIVAMVRRYILRPNNLKANTDMNTTVYKVNGMACPHCQATVTKAISALPGVENVNVDLAAGTATVQGDVTHSAIKQAIELAGFELA